MRHKFASAALLLALPVFSVAQSGITADKNTKPLGNERWEWTVFVKGDPKLIAQISCVQYELHPTFPNRFRRVCDRGSQPSQAFPLTATGWGTFDIPVTLTFADRHTEKFTYHLRFDNPAQTGSGCNKAGAFAIKERAIQPMGSDLPGMYLYAEEIHNELRSNFRLLKSARTIKPGNFNWSHHAPNLFLRPRRVTTLSDSDNNAYVPFSASAGKPVPLPVSGSRTTLYFNDPQEHRSINVIVCR